MAEIVAQRTLLGSITCIFAINYTPTQFCAMQMRQSSSFFLGGTHINTTTPTKLSRGIDTTRSMQVTASITLLHVSLCSRVVLQVKCCCIAFYQITTYTQHLFFYGASAMYKVVERSKQSSCIHQYCLDSMGLRAVIHAMVRWIVLTSFYYYFFPSLTLFLSRLHHRPQ